MSHTIDPEVARLVRTDFATFVAFAFQDKHGEALGNQPYIALLCYMISGLISRKTRRLLINLPPQHLKTFVCTTCLAAFLLGENPKLRILVVAYGDTYATKLAGIIRDMMNTPWYRQIFATRIKTGHDRVNDFETTAGGGVYAAGAQGAITGYPADVIIYDDPHQINDNKKALTAVKDNFSNVLSRMQNKITGRIIVVAHRVSTEDLSADLLSEPDWRSLRLPLVAPARRTYDLGHDDWVRERGDILRPDAYSELEIERLRRKQVAPPYALFQQQGVDRQASRRITAEHFRSHEKYEIPIAPVVISIDPGQSGGINASRSAIQAWASSDGKCHYLLDQSCDHYDFEQLRKEARRFIKKHNPSVVLLEKTANGPALYTDLKKLNPRFEIKLVPVAKLSKAERLETHRFKILKRRISLPSNAIWRAQFIDEIIGFPGEFDDQVDAMTQYLDFMGTKPIIKRMPPREHGIAIVTGSSMLRQR